MSQTTDPHEAHGYETRDAQPHWMLLGGALLLLLMALAFVLMYGLDNALERRDRRAAEPPHPMSTYRTAPTAAPLQASPRLDYEAYAARQHQLLTSYGWVDPSQDVVRIPIERAMELIAERGLPATAADEEGGR